MINPALVDPRREALIRNGHSACEANRGKHRQSLENSLSHAECPFFICASRRGSTRAGFIIILNQAGNFRVIVSLSFFSLAPNTRFLNEGSSARARKNFNSDRPVVSNMR